MNPYLEIARPWQWYKNVVVFLALFFAGRLFDFESVLSAALTFVSLCLLSSAVYIFNDILDVERDRLHPVKRKRPLPSGRLSVFSATVFGALLFLSGLSLAFAVSPLVLLSAVALVVNTVLYTLFFKHIAFLDVAVLALNFLFRTLAGVFAVGVYPSYWIIIIPYFVAVFLALLKRYGELQKTRDARPSLGGYDAETLRTLSAVIAGLVLLLYTLYVFDSNIPRKTLTAVTTIPVAVFTLFRWYSCAVHDPEVAEDAAKMVYDAWFLAGCMLWAAVLFFAVYF